MLIESKYYSFENKEKVGKLWNRCEKLEKHESSLSAKHANIMTEFVKQKTYLKGYHFFLIWKKLLESELSAGKRSFQIFFN